jgi:hypothetical protein
MKLKNSFLLAIGFLFFNNSIAQQKYSITVECFSLNFTKENTTKHSPSSTLVDYKSVVTGPSVYLLPTRIYLGYSFFNKRKINFGFSASFNKINASYNYYQISNKLDFSDTINFRVKGKYKFDFFGIMLFISKKYSVHDLYFNISLQAMVSSTYNRFDSYNAEFFNFSNPKRIDFYNEYTKNPNSWECNLTPTVSLDYPLYKNLFLGIKYIAGLDVNIQNGKAETSRINKVVDNNVVLLNDVFFENLQSNKLDLGITQNASLFLQYKFGKHK